MHRFRYPLLLVAVVVFPASSQPPAVPKLEPIAETKLLMEGIAQPNFHGLNRALKQKPTGADAWGFSRGQALLIAETGNLLMMRPPKEKAAQDLWLRRSAELREAGTSLGRAAAAKDYVSARAGLAIVANACNRCHESFRVPTRVVPFDGE